MAARDAAIRRRFTTEQGFVDVMYEIGVGENERNRIVADGFVNMTEYVTQFENNVEGLITYLRNLNRTFATAIDPAVRVYFPPPIVNRMAGVLYYASQCYFSFHTIPDVGMITSALATDYYKNYTDQKGLKIVKVLRIWTF